MKTQAECYQALLDGKKLVSIHSGPYGEVLLMSGTLCFDSNNQRASIAFDNPEEWSIYIEPKKPKLINVQAYKDATGEIRFFEVMAGGDYRKWIKEDGWKRLPSLDRKDVEVE